MSDWLERTELLFGNENIEKLKNSRVAIFGIGGVGSFTAEALARSGIGTLDLIDNDTVSQSNLNRQLIALHSTLGKYKVEVMRDRILDINPNAKINIYKTFFMPECSGDFDFSNYDYVVDAIDTVTGKLELVLKCDELKTP
ncbi:MAG: ThiF family adenylyltransferase, partial [Oscillospiraceae bacterium]